MDASLQWRGPTGYGDGESSLVGGRSLWSTCGESRHPKNDACPAQGLVIVLEPTVVTGTRLAVQLALIASSFLTGALDRETLHMLNRAKRLSGYHLAECWAALLVEGMARVLATGRISSARLGSELQPLITHGRRIATCLSGCSAVQLSRAHTHPLTHPAYPFHSDAAMVAVDRGPPRL